MSDNETDAVQYRPSPNGITTITLTRKLYDTFLNYEADDSQKVCVFYGLHGTFCAGADLHAVADDSLTDVAHLGPVRGRYIAPMGPSRMQLRKPAICAVSVYALAVGLELSLLGDMRVAEDDAVFGVFCRRFGGSLIDGGTVRLSAIVGLGRAMDMILTGRAMGAPQALSLGLANSLVQKGKAFEEAMTIAEQLLNFPQLCMNKDRQSAYYATF
ncbi:ClpP/crotonase-like domain-containing protein [Ampelomyces quisqualis]|uniref:ClpP/crotonase-like domain-containing protein n=1 Tax=Ampelomyces quisqualis TaxID=50730 RepID=A0A6A5QLS7_AMPQU|nr:ClpP/crotonase-like domain-containing protein [Ampelomyces quisqualis]